jgi:hypothetical protein
MPLFKPSRLLQPGNCAENVTSLHRTNHIQLRMSVFQSRQHFNFISPGWLYIGTYANAIATVRHGRRSSHLGMCGTGPMKPLYCDAGYAVCIFLNMDREWYPC